MSEAELRSLLFEAVSDDMIQNPESSYSTCLWCGHSWGTRYNSDYVPHILEYYIIQNHAPDCWVVRTRAALGIPPVLYDWSYRSHCEASEWYNRLATEALKDAP